jgi:very-short-patch-repair endonuclease
LRLGKERLTVDFLWPDRRLVVETDGRATHATPVPFQRDRRRDQILVAAGYRVARATWDQMHGELEAVVTRIISALNAPHPELRGSFVAP